MQIIINSYYLKFIDSMIQQLGVSIPGQRRWVFDQSTGAYDYSATIRSTFPMWSKFFYIKTPKKLKGLIYEPYNEGYFNGNTSELIKLLINSTKGSLSKSPRLRLAFDLAISGFYDEIYEFEYQYGEPYFLIYT